MTDRPYDFDDLEEILTWDGNLEQRHIPESIEEVYLRDPIFNRAIDVYDREEDVTLVGALAFAVVALCKERSRRIEAIIEADLSTPPSHAIPDSTSDN